LSAMVSVPHKSIKPNLGVTFGLIVTSEATFGKSEAEIWLDCQICGVD